MGSVSNHYCLNIIPVSRSIKATRYHSRMVVAVSESFMAPRFLKRVICTPGTCARTLSLAPLAYSKQYLHLNPLSRSIKATRYHRRMVVAVSESFMAPRFSKRVICTPGTCARTLYLAPRLLEAIPSSESLISLN